MVKAMSLLALLTLTISAHAASKEWNRRMAMQSYYCIEHFDEVLTNISNYRELTEAFYKIGLDQPTNAHSLREACHSVRVFYSAQIIDVFGAPSECMPAGGRFCGPLVIH